MIHNFELDEEGGDDENISIVNSNMDSVASADSQDLLGIPK